MNKLLDSEKNISSTVTNLLVVFARKHKAYISILIFGGIFWAITLPITPYLLGHIVDQIKAADNQNVFLFGLIAFPVITFIIINFLRNLLYYITGYVFSKSLPALKANTILDMLSYLGNQSYRYFESQQSGFLTNKITNAVNSIEPVIVSLLTIIFPRTLTLIFSGMIMATVSPLFMMITWAWAIVLIFYTYKTAGFGRKLSRELANSSSVANGKIVDYVTNVIYVLFSSTQKEEAAYIKPSLSDMAEKDRKMQYYITKVRFIQGFMTTIFIILVMIVLIYGYKQRWVTAGDFAFILFLVFGIMGLVYDLGTNVLDFYKYIGRLQEGLSLMEDEYEVFDTPNAKDYEIKKGSILVEKVSFKYERRRKIFKDLFLEIKPGEKIGIVGGSGVGKTTIIKLLMRLYDVQAGKIKVDDINIKDYTLVSLRRQISLVAQESTLFHRTIFDNINYGGGISTKREVIKAAKHAHCHDFIMKLPDKYQTYVGERGVKLSGGQRQRIVIARAILQDCPILLLDEATSALDSETEAKIQESLDFLMRNRTAVVVAHRLSTLKTMDRIIVLDSGKIAEEGSHISLLHKEGIYHRLWQHQSGGFLKPESSISA